ncbi:MAG: NAD(P)-dependent oxidoreductase [Calditrichaceae bacterium]|nr:NAD(P)-dependent oxidoreductase [Calditrichaceae bacterium]
MDVKIPSIIITGASGFVGKALLDEFKNEFRIFAIARRSQLESGAPVHENIAWIRADVSDVNSVSKAFREIKTAGGADYLIHLAAYYDFTGEDKPQYQNTNVDGTRNVLNLSKELNLRLFIFVSSTAASDFPGPGQYLNEDSPPDSDFNYARSKRLGEKMMEENASQIPNCIVRFGAVYSDWCEYPPLYMFLNTWLGKSWRKNILSGKGQSAVPYIHIRDIAAFFSKLLSNYKKLKPAQIVIASTSGSTTHEQLFRLATRYYKGSSDKPFYMPVILCGVGLYSMYFFGKLINKLPFERPWMYRYIDLQLNIENKKTCELIDWYPQERYYIEKRMPFLVERLKSDPNAWHLRNQAVLISRQDRPDLQIHTALVNAEIEIMESLLDFIFLAENNVRFTFFQKLGQEEVKWFIKLLFQLLLTSIYAGNKLLLLNYFEVSSFGRFKAGYKLSEISNVLRKLNELTVDKISATAGFEKYQQLFYDYITLPIEFGIDEVEHQYPLYQVTEKPAEAENITIPDKNQNPARVQLEETIWKCLVNRK